MVPVHLITRDAFREYLARLDEHGVLAAHISSQYFRLEPVLAVVARDVGLVCLYQHHQVPPQEVERGIVSSRWVLMARRVEDLAGLAEDTRWRRMESDPGERVWTDDYANVVGAVIWSREAEARQRLGPAGLGR